MRDEASMDDEETLQRDALRRVMPLPEEDAADELADALNAMMRARNEAQASYARAQAACSQQVLAAERGVEIARASACAVESEIEQLGSYLSDMHKNHTLDLYVRRRRAEVFAESRTAFVRRTP